MHKVSTAAVDKINRELNALAELEDRYRKLVAPDRKVLAQIRKRQEELRRMKLLAAATAAQPD